MLSSTAHVSIGLLSYLLKVSLILCSRYFLLEISTFFVERKQTCQTLNIAVKRPFFLFCFGDRCSKETAVLYPLLITLNIELPRDILRLRYINKQERLKISWFRNVISRSQKIWDLQTTQFLKVIEKMYGIDNGDTFCKY